jgi:hypothetical protein
MLEKYAWESNGTTSPGMSVKTLVRVYSIIIYFNFHNLVDYLSEDLFLLLQSVVVRKTKLSMQRYTILILYLYTIYKM